MELDFTAGSLLGRHSQLFHIGVACRSLEDAMSHLGQLFDVRWTPIADDTAPNLFTSGGPSQWSARRTHSIASPIPIELLEGSPGSTWDTPKVVTMHHVAYWSPDVGADVRAVQHLIDPIGSFGRGRRWVHAGAGAMVEGHRAGRQQRRDPRPLGKREQRVPVLLE